MNYKNLLKIVVISAVSLFSLYLYSEDKISKDEAQNYIKATNETLENTTLELNN